MSKTAKCELELQNTYNTKGFISSFSNVFLRIIAKAGVDLTILTFMVILLSILVPSVGGRIKWFQTGVVMPIIMMATLILYDFLRWIYSRYTQGEKTAQAFLAQIPVILRDWLPFLLIAFIYENLHDLSGHLAFYNIAEYMHKFDLLVFGFEPTVWCQKIYSPILTDIMSMFYAVYLILPLVLMFFLSLSYRRSHFRKISIAIVFTFIMGFTMYVVFPCLPPRFYITYTSPEHMQGMFLHYHLQGMWDNLSVVKGAAFPSLHVAISSVALIYAYKFRTISKLYNIIWYLYIPIVIGLWFSTIYLRHHWIGDIMAGWIVAMLSVYFSEKSIKARKHLLVRFKKQKTIR